MKKIVLFTSFLSFTLLLFSLNAAELYNCLAPQAENHRVIEFLKNLKNNPWVKLYLKRFNDNKGFDDIMQVLMNEEELIGAQVILNNIDNHEFDEIWKQTIEILNCVVSYCYYGEFKEYVKKIQKIEGIAFDFTFFSLLLHPTHGKVDFDHVLFQLENYDIFLSLLNMLKNKAKERGEVKAEIGVQIFLKYSALIMLYLINEEPGFLKFNEKHIIENIIYFGYYTLLMKPERLVDLSQEKEWVQYFLDALDQTNLTHKVKNKQYVEVYQKFINEMSDIFKEKGYDVDIASYIKSNQESVLGCVDEALRSLNDISKFEECDIDQSIEALQKFYLQLMKGEGDASFINEAA